MTMTAIFCRDQERTQRSRAATATLANSRHIADCAANAWAAEAILAEARENRQRRLAGVAAGPLLTVDSENPDRGRADA